MSSVSVVLRCGGRSERNDYYRCREHVTREIEDKRRYFPLVCPYLALSMEWRGLRAGLGRRSIASGSWRCHGGASRRGCGKRPLWARILENVDICMPRICPDVEYLVQIMSQGVEARLVRSLSLPLVSYALFRSLGFLEYLVLHLHMGAVLYVALVFFCCLLEESLQVCLPCLAECTPN